jgi:hypothetical protein
MKNLMTRTRLIVLAAALATGSIVGVVAYTATAQAGGSVRPAAPPIPSWVDSQGNVDLAKEPPMPIWAPNGDGVQHNADGSVTLYKQALPTGGPFGK